MLPQSNLSRPAAIAFSGGGDSTAMLHAFRGNPLATHAFIIDHNLRDGSASEVVQAAEWARSLGYIVETDVWAHDGVTTGIQVKAREYRYSALGRMCRAAGLSNLITAHTADDQAETLLMRLDRKTGWRGLAGMPTQAYAPLWPALAGVTLHRPWLDVSRSDLRHYNATESLAYIDDPSNENRDFTRVRARQALAGDPALRADLLEQQQIARARLTAERGVHGEWLTAYACINPHGFVETDAVPPTELCLHILNAVSGKGGPIDAAKRLRLWNDMNQSNFKAATLSGAWIIKSVNGFVFARDMVAVSGRKGQSGLGTVDVLAGQNTLWDGRFYVRAKNADIQIKPAFGKLKYIKQISDFKCFSDFPKEIRPSLPLYFEGRDLIGFGASETEKIAAQATAASRLQALYPTSKTVPI